MEFKEMAREFAAGTTGAVTGGAVEYIHMGEIANVALLALVGGIVGVVAKAIGGLIVTWFKNRKG